jgi:hypothetical protein
MSDRLAQIEERLAALERVVATLQPQAPATPADKKDPLDGHPLIWKKPPREVLEKMEAEQLKALGIDHLKPIGAQAVRQMMIDEGIDPNGNEFSRGIIEMREE